MERDVRGSATYEKVLDLYHHIYQPGSGLISDASEISVSADGRLALFSGTIVEKLEGLPPTRICKIELGTGATEIVTSGSHVDRSPKFAPVGTAAAFLSDRQREGDFQLYLLDAETGEIRPTPSPDGWVEYFHWSPSGKRILMGVAGHGADVAGGQGAVTSKSVEGEVPAWFPSFDDGQGHHLWRNLYVYEVDTNELKKIPCDGINVWESAWVGETMVAAVCSNGPGEGLWYTAEVELIEVESGSHRLLYHPQDQIGLPAANPCGSVVALVEAVCSDRWIVAGDLLIGDVSNCSMRAIDTKGVDVTYVEWRSDKLLLVAGHRGPETVVGYFDLVETSFVETWSSQSVTTGGFYVTVSGFDANGSFAMIAEGFMMAPEVAIVERGKYRAIRSFQLHVPDQYQQIASIESITWQAPDGLAIQGWLIRPKAKAPHPLIVGLHGGPVWQTRPFWLSRRSALVLTLVEQGYAFLFPNPRGSSGFGRAFARKVVGDLGGADTFDHLSGVDHLIAAGLVDAKRMAVTGGSYGGFMTAWLITQDDRFAAAVAVAPVANHVSEHLISNIPHFVQLFLADKLTNLDGKYYSRSPILFADRVKTPCMNVAGDLDRCTPPEEAVQFHRALLENGVESVLLIYPGEGHGVRRWPAAIDYYTRLIEWFTAHLGTAGGTSEALPRAS
jgi:dipeptidyl aminopeptidase/acylaminoacyl peptidase